MPIILKTNRLILRLPEGPARVLLQVAAKHPEAVWDVVRPATRRVKRATASS